MDYIQDPNQNQSEASKENDCEDNNGNNTTSNSNGTSDQIQSLIDHGEIDAAEVIEKKSNEILIFFNIDPKTVLSLIHPV